MQMYGFWSSVDQIFLISITKVEAPVPTDWPRMCGINHPVCYWGDSSTQVVILTWGVSEFVVQGTYLFGMIDDFQSLIRDGIPILVISIFFQKH